MKPRERREKIPIPEDLLKTKNTVDVRRKEIDIIPASFHLQEERRLFYVAMTRAKDKLFLTGAKFYGEGKREKKPSPFITEAVPGFINKPNIENAPEQLSLLDLEAEYKERKAIKEEIVKPEIKSISFSQMQTFDICPLHYKARYILGIPTAPSSAQSYGITLHHALNDFYKEALEKDYFCKRADGPYMKGKVWPGECNFPDYTNPAVREWWAGLFKELVAEIGVKGVWNDMNEPAVMEVPNKTFPMDVRHVYDGNPCSHRKAHNIYGTQMARATYHGVKRFAYPKRPFVITRSAYSGAQRYTSSWTGDNVATWEHLWIANIQVQRMSISGMGFTGSDIGGFAEQPTGELYARWIQLGVFHPFCRTHSSGDHGNQEPWAFDEEVINITRKFVSLRYQLLPYLYTMFWQYIEEGIPMLKPLVYFDQDDTQTHYRNDEFIFGNQILVCPILEPNAVGRRMYIPRGEWYNYWTNEFSVGGREVWIDTKFDEIPVFVKAGAVIPKYPVQQYVGELEFDELTLDVYYKNGKEKSVVYEDAQDGYDYKKGRYSFLSFRTVGKEKELIIQLHKEGKYDTPYSKYKINLIGLPFKVSEIEIDNEKIQFDKTAFEVNQFLIVEKGFSELHIIGE